MLLAGCGGCGSDDAASDGGPEPAAEEPLDEGGAMDAGDAAADDAAPDALVDASTDAAADGGTGPYPEAGWVPLPGLPDGCVVERAEVPERVFVPEWEPCPAPLEACEVLAFPEDDGRERRILANRGSHDGERGYVVFSERPVPGPGRWVTVLAATSGTPAGAWRFPDRSAGGGLCGVVRFGLAPNAAAFGLNISGDPPPRQVRVYHAPLSEIGSRTEPDVVLGSSDIGGRFSQHVQTSDTTVGIELQPAGRVLIVEEGEARVVEPTAEVGGAPQNVAVLGRHVLWEDWPSTAGVRIAQATIDAGPSVYLAPDGAEVRSFDADGGRMAWLQAYGPKPEGGYDRLEIWTAMHTPDPADLTPTKVTELPARVGENVAGEFYTDILFTDGRLSLVMYDLTDGRRKTLALPDPWIPSGGVLYIHDGEVLLGVSHADRGGTVMRMEFGAIPYE